MALSREAKRRSALYGVLALRGPLHYSRRVIYCLSTFRTRTAYLLSAIPDRVVAGQVESVPRDPFTLLIMLSVIWQSKESVPG